MASLKPEIAAAVKVFEPNSLRPAFLPARYKEEELASWRSTIGRFPRAGGIGGGGIRSGGRGANAPIGTGPSTGGAVTSTRQAPRPLPKGFVRLSPQEIEQKRREGKCFNYDKRFTVGHKCAKPDLMMLVGRWEDEAEEEAAEEGPPKLE
ncbi:unnamed protein product [Linum trigynum]|uniref:Uncharacterized protein n=1 Tax=Linum trigynum TaxID=586398 RepID=A0AAV2FB61_9ROSI